MSVTISSSELEATIQGAYSPYNLRKSGVIHFDKKYGDIKLDYHSTGNGITYSSYIATFNHDTILEGSSHEDISFLSFNTGKSLSIENHHTKEASTFDTNRCWHGKIYKTSESKGFYTKGQPYISQHITFKSTLFDTLSKEQPKLYTQKPIIENDHFLLNLHHDISIKQKKLLKNLLETSHLDNKLQELYLESKVLDLVYTSIHETAIEKTDAIYLSTEDTLSLHKAKEILLNNLVTPPSLKELAHKTATNEFKLKKGFKQLFGNTVYGLLQEYRLKEAKELLERNEINVNEAAHLVGYKSIGHFSKIFKEHFGVLASDVIKHRKYYHSN